VGTLEDDEIRTLVARLCRPHPSGGVVIERAAILAEGSDSSAILSWVLSHQGTPETTAPKAASGGLYGGRQEDRAGAPDRPPRRYVLPPGSVG
jgi:hypothetical protein